MEATLTTGQTLQMPPEMVADLRNLALADTPDGFRWFYQFINNQMLPDHAFAWVEGIYAARKEGKGIVVEAFRGSTKTTTFYTFVAYRTGLNPVGTSLIVGYNDDMANDTAAKIADIIKNNMMWRIFFPNVVPDEPTGWSMKGYETMRTDMPYEEWRRMRGRDPSFVGYGYSSGNILGKHPTNVLLIDDMDKEENTTSDRERGAADKAITGTIFPTMTPETWPITIGTPWTMKDTIAYVKGTGQFLPIKTAVYANGAPTWPDKFPEEEIEKQRRLAGTVEFARMFLLDLEAAKGAYLKRDWLHKYPSEKVHPSWPVFMGVDYASTQDHLRDKDRDNCAIAIGRAIPGGGVVVIDGFVGHLSQGEAEQKLRALADMYPTLKLIGVENVGKGEEFYSLLLRTTNLPIMPCRTQGKSKGSRFQKQLAPLFEYSRAWVADVETPFLKKFTDEWVSWDGTDAVQDDTLDAVWYMCATGQWHLMAKPEDSGKLPSPWYTKTKKANPFKALGTPGGNSGQQRTQTIPNTRA